MTIQLPYELEVKFRRTAKSKYGSKRGMLSQCAIEALEEWCIKQWKEYRLWFTNGKLKSKIFF